MGFNRAKNCLTLFLAALPMFCRGLSPPGCLGTDGQYYAPGDLMPSSNPCEVDCICKGFDQIECNVMDCARPPCENPIRIEGQCCPVCGGCEKDGVIYNTGDLMPSSNPCEVDCRCKGFDQIVCSITDCARPPCENPIHIEGHCCPVCGGCNKDGVVYNTGKIVQNVTCNPLICQSNGSIKAESVHCEKLQCIDPVIPTGKCCPECKNGRTCAHKTVIIKYGEDKMIGNKICRCGGDPWFPNAFCAEKNVSEKLLKDFGQYLAKYKP